MLTLITGGARSGKSSFAQSLCADASKVTYIATARPDDAEMQRRIFFHQQSRPGAWLTIEEPIFLAEAVKASILDSDILLIDCITVWLSNLLFEWRDEEELLVERRAREQAALLIQASRPGHVVAVTNEVGSGIVPESAVARQFRDLQGFVNQQLAEAANAVHLVVSGIPLQIKPAWGKAL